MLVGCPCALFTKGTFSLWNCELDLTVYDCIKTYRGIFVIGEMSQNRLALQLLFISSGALAMKSRDDTPAVEIRNVFVCS